MRVALCKCRPGLQLQAYLDRARAIARRHLVCALVSIAGVLVLHAPVQRR
jgi:hypothetical protein